MGSHITAIGKKWRESKVRPIPGNSPHDRPVSRGISSSLKESLRRSLPRHRIPHQPRIILGTSMRFLRHGGIYLVRWGSTSKVKTKSQAGTRPPPAGRPRAQAKERAGRNTLFLIVRR